MFGRGFDSRNWIDRKNFFKRYIDDILIIFTGSYEEFNEFFESINNFHETIKFDTPDHDKESNSCHFLDITISIEKDKGKRDSETSIRNKYNKTCKIDNDTLSDNISNVHIHNKIQDINCDLTPCVVLENEQGKEHIKTVHENTKPFMCNECSFNSNN